MRSTALQQRTKDFALRVIKMCAALPRNDMSSVICRQLLRSATSVGANYRSACRARSQNDFVAKMALVEEESDESAYWLELLMESGQIRPMRLSALHREVGELTALAAASRKTARRRSLQRPQNAIRHSTIDIRHSS